MIAVLCVMSCTLPAQQAAPPELERVTKTLQTLNDLKVKVTALQQQLDDLIQELSIEKGVLANAKPAPFGGVSGVTTSTSIASDPPKPKPARCAAITAKGVRCSRAAIPGSRYCMQHQTAHQQ